MIQSIKRAASIFYSRGKSVPIVAILTTNVSCNARCPYCYVDKHVKGQKDMLWTALRDIIDELAALGCMEVVIQGGESLLREDIATIVQHAKSKGLRVMLATNGILLAKKVNQLSGVDAIRVSIDGDEEFNDAVKNTQGYFRQAVNGLRKARELGIKCSLNCQMLRGTKKQLNFLWQLASELQIGVQFLYTFITEPHQRKNDFNGNLSGEEYRSLVGNIIDAKRHGAPVLSSEYALRHSAGWDLLYQKPHSDVRVLSNEVPTGVCKRICYAGYNMVHIDVNGDLWPCSLCSLHGANIFTAGSVSKALKLLVNLKENCVDCVNPPHIDMNAALSLNPRVLLHYYRVARRYR